MARYISTDGAGLGFTVDAIDVVTKGGAGGPRVATCGFSQGFALGGRRHGRIAVAVEMDGADWQDDAPMNRRAGRAAVPALRQLASAILAGGGDGQVERDIRRRGVCTVSFRHVGAAPDGRPFDRRAVIYLDVRMAGTEPDAELIGRAAPAAAKALERLAGDIHGALDSRQLASVFGAG